MKRAPAQKRGRSRHAENDAGGGAARAIAPGIVAEMEQQRNLLELQNEELARAHAALEISHQRFAELHEQAPIGYLTFDAQGCIRDINTEAERLLGTRRATAIGKPFVVYVEQPERRKFLQHLWKMQRTGSTVATDLQLAPRDGTLRQVRISTARHRDAAGRGRFLSAIEDVTELRAASASATYLAAIVESSQDAIASFTPEGIVQSWNRGAEQLFGYTASEMIGRPVSVLAPPDRSEETRRILKVSAAGGRVPPFESVRRRKDGSLVDVEISRFPILAQGRVIATAAIWRDISERKAMEAALHESERLARSTVEAIPAQIAVIAKDGKIIHVNEAWRRFALANGGTEKKMGPGVNYLDVCEHVHGMGRRQAVRFAMGIRAVAAGRKEMFSMEYPCNSPNQKRWFTGYVSPFIGKGDRRMVVSHVNITAVKLAEEKFHALLESAPDAVVVVDREGKIQITNKEAEKMFRYTKKELFGAQVETLLPAAARTAHVGHRADYAARPSARPMGRAMNLAALRKDGSEFPVEVSLSPLETEAGLLVCSVIRDITERKEADDAIRKLNAELEERVAARTGELTATNKSLKDAIEQRRRLEQEVIEISETEGQRIGQDLHDDLGQQLAGVRLFVSKLENTLRSRSLPEAGDAAKIAGILDNALALTRSLARGLQPVIPEPGGLMASLHELAGRSTQLFRIPCRLHCRYPVKISDPSTATHLYRIAQEAVTNAARHGKAKRIAITLSANAGNLELSVSDDGTGLDPQAGRSEGMGIRTMTYRAEALGGSLAFRPRPRGGTRVICRIPIRPKSAKKTH